jgi:hypothetical protein
VILDGAAHDIVGAARREHSGTGIAQGAHIRVIFERHESRPISRGSVPVMAGFPAVAQST